MDTITAYIRDARALLFARLSLALVMVWFGFMNFTEVGEDIVSRWLTGHALLAGLAGDGDQYANLLGIVQVLSGLGLAAGVRPFVRAGAMAAGLLALGALTLLLFAPVWIEALGGFPAIGAGQGVLKYITIFGVAMFIAAANWGKRGEQRSDRDKERALAIIVAGLVVVLGWIGAMKFTLPEAEGIDPLLRTSLLFSWIPNLLGLRGAANLIGVIEIAAALALLGWFFNRKVFLAGAALTALTLLATLSFLVTLPGWQDSLGGFPWLSRAGQFLLKDLILLAGVVLLVAHSERIKT